MSGPVDEALIDAGRAAPAIRPAAEMTGRGGLRRVVITGAGTINALGHDVATTLEAFREGRCGITQLDFRDVDRLSIQIGGQVHDWTPEMEDGAAIAHELDDIRSWRSAMKTMDRNSWHALYPLEAHPEFGEKIWQARQRRCKVHCLDRYEEEWKRVCRGIESDVSLIEGGGESDASSNTTRDGLTEYSKCGASQPDGEDPAIACARRMLEMVAILHKMGYEQLRIFPIIGMSGMAWRCRVLPAGLMSRENGALPVDEDIVPDGRNCAYFSTNMPTKFFGLIVPGTLTPRQLAEDFIAEYPEIVQLGRGADPEYAAWYREMLILTAPSNLLWVTSDAMGDDDYMRPGKLSTAGPHIDLYLDMPPPFRSR